VADLRRVLPSDLTDVVQRLGLRRNALWREVMAARPDADQPLREHGKAEPVRVCNLPEPVQGVAEQAIYLTWLHCMLGVTNPPPWVADLDCLWVRLTYEPTDRPLAVWLADVPGTSGYIHMRQFAVADTAPPLVSSRPREVRDVSQLLASLVSDLVDMARVATEVRGALADALPADAEALTAELSVQAVERFRSAEAGLTDEQRGRMGTAESVSARELATEVREALRQAVAVLWARDVCANIAHPPPWAVEPRASRVEFGLYPHTPGLGDAAGREYVRVWAPEGHHTLQTGIYG
jgi:hypothetical protein